MPRTRKRSHAPTKTASRIKKTYRRLIAWVLTHRQTVGLWFFMLGFLLVTFPTVYKTLSTGSLQPPKASTRETSAATAQTVVDLGPIRIDQKLLGVRIPTQPPMRVVIPSRKIDLSVVEAPVVDGYWELSETSASHGVGSANPGQVGNTVIFAHAREGFFLPLRDIQKEEVIYVLTKDRWYRYKVVQTQLVDPNQVEVIAPTSDETLTLFTCSGFLDTKRLIVTAKPIN